MQEVAHKAISVTVITDIDPTGKEHQEHRFVIQPFVDESGASVLLSCDVFDGHDKPMVQETNDEFDGLPWKNEIRIPVGALDDIKEAIESIAKHLKGEYDV